MPSIDDYDVGQLLGKGGFACVYRARHRISGENIALKVISKSIATTTGPDGTNTINRVKNEIIIHSQLKHNNIVRFMGCFEDNHNIYMALELCNYGNMFQYLKRNGPLSESVAVSVIQQLILALEYIHEHGVVHRDLKLSNILLARPDISDCMNDKALIKICDFGLAIKKQHPDEEHYTLCGTPNYIAPEIASQHAHGYPADLWSIGCLFYSLVVGTPPFEKGRDEESALHGNDVKDTLQRILSGEYHEPVEQLSDNGVLFLRSLLHLNPHKRANVKQLLAHPLLSSPSSLLPPPPPPASSHTYTSSFHLNLTRSKGREESLEGHRSDSHPSWSPHPQSTHQSPVIDSDRDSRKGDAIKSSVIRSAHPGTMDHKMSTGHSLDEPFFDRNANNNSSATTALISCTTPLSSDSNATTTTNNNNNNNANNTTDHPYRSGNSTYDARSREAIKTRAESMHREGMSRPVPSSEPILQRSRTTKNHNLVSGRPMTTLGVIDHRIVGASSKRVADSRSIEATTELDSSIPCSQPSYRSAPSGAANATSSPTATPAATSISKHPSVSADMLPRDVVGMTHHSVNDSVHYQRSHRISVPPPATHTSIQVDRSQSSSSWYDAIVDMRSSTSSVNNSSNSITGVTQGFNNDVPRQSLRTSAYMMNNSWISQYAHDKFIDRKGGEDVGSHRDRMMDSRSSRSAESHIPPSSSSDHSISNFHDIVHSMSALRPLVLVTKREDLLLITLEHSLLFYTKVKIKVNHDASHSNPGGLHRTVASKVVAESPSYSPRTVRLIIRPSMRYTVQFGAVAVDDAVSLEVRGIVQAVHSKETMIGVVDHQLDPSSQRRQQQQQQQQSADRLQVETTSFKFHDEFSEQRLRVFAHNASLQPFHISSGQPIDIASSSPSLGRTGRLPTVIVQLLQKIVKALNNIKCQVPKQIFYLFTPSFKVSLHPQSTTMIDSTSNRSPGSRGSSSLISPPRQHEGSAVDCKCMLMCNDPLPDFYIQWVDGVKLRYVLQTGRVRIDGTAHCHPIYWEGNLHLSDAATDTSIGALMAPAIAAQVVPYLQVAQQAFRRCLSEQDQWDKSTLRSTIPGHGDHRQTPRPKILVL